MPESRKSRIGSEVDFLGNELLRQLHENSQFLGNRLLEALRNHKRPLLVNGCIYTCSCSKNSRYARTKQTQLLDYVFASSVGESARRGAEQEKLRRRQTEEVQNRHQR
jgi:hypothetical protein